MNNLNSEKFILEFYGEKFQSVLRIYSLLKEGKLDPNRSFMPERYIYNELFDYDDEGEASSSVYITLIKEIIKLWYYEDTKKFLAVEDKEKFISEYKNDILKMLDYYIQLIEDDERRKYGDYDIED